MYTVIGNPKSRTFRVVWALEEMGLEYKIVAARPHDDTVTRHNPAGKIPVLLDGDQAISDSAAIVQYLADKHGQLTSPAGTIERAQQDSCTQFACDELDGTLWAVAKHSFVYPERLRLDAAKDAGQWDFARAVNTLTARLGDSSYIMGAELTVPDIIITHCAGWAKNSGFDMPGEKIEAYLQRVRARPAFAKATALRDAA